MLHLTILKRTVMRSRGWPKIRSGFLSLQIALVFLPLVSGSWPS